MQLWTFWRRLVGVSYAQLAIFSRIYVPDNLWTWVFCENNAKMFAAVIISLRQFVSDTYL